MDAILRKTEWRCLDRYKKAEAPGQARRSSSTPTTPRCGPTTWRTRRCTSTSTRPSRTVGPGPALPGHAGHGRLRRKRAEAKGFADLRPHGPQRRPEGRDSRQPQPRSATRRSTSDNFYTKFGPAPTRSPSTSPAWPSPAARPSSTRPVPASTSRRTSATTSCSTSATSGPTCRAGTPTRSLKLPNPTYYLPAARTSPASAARPGPAAQPLHDAARRLQRRAPRAARASPTSTR